LAPITELGLDLILRQEVASSVSDEFAADELVADSGLSSIVSPSVEAGEVTRVERLPLRDPHDNEDSADDELDGSMQIEIIDEGTEEWEVPLAVIEDTGSVDFGAGKPRTVVTAPMDDSLVAGELHSKTPRPEHVRPLAENSFDSAATGIAEPKPSAKIPPANLAHKKLFRGPSSKAFSSDSKQQEKTRVLAVADLEEVPTGKVDALAAEEEEDGLRTRLVPSVGNSVAPRPPKLPSLNASTAKPPNVARIEIPRPPSSRAAHSAKTRVVLTPLKSPAQPVSPANPASPPSIQGDPESPPPDDRG
jgi:hypothetical protein